MVCAAKMMMAGKAAPSIEPASSEPVDPGKGRELALRLLCSYKLEAKADPASSRKRKNVVSKFGPDFDGILGTPAQTMVFTHVSLPSFGRRDALLCVNGGILSIFEVLSPVWPLGDRNVVAPHGTVVALARGSAALSLTLGKGAGGTSLPRTSQSGAQPSLTLNTSS